MTTDDLFTYKEPGRSSGILAEKVVKEEPTTFHSFEEWKDYYVKVLNYPMMVSILMPKIDMSGMQDFVYNMRNTIIESIFETYTYRHCYEWGLNHLDNGQYLCRFVDFNKDPMNYVRFVFWITMFFYRTNEKNKEYINKEPFSKYAIVFSSNHHDFCSMARVKYTSSLEICQYPACLIGSITKDIFLSDDLHKLGFDNINVHRLLKWQSRMKKHFNMTKEEMKFIINSAHKFGDGLGIRSSLHGWL